MGQRSRMPRRRRAAAVVVLGLAAVIAGLVLLLLPFSNGYESCGNAVVSATAPGNDDSWFSTCADVRGSRRDTALPLLELGLVAAGAGTGRFWWVSRIRRWA